MRIVYLVGFLVCLLPVYGYAQLYEVNGAKVNFHSDAPQELIKASSGKLRGYIDIQSKTFAFIIDIKSFMGFNSPLQQEHFNENYMESTVYPQAMFTGKIIEDVNVLHEGIYKVRAKGKMKIHGIEQERIINSVIVSKDGKLDIKSDFILSLADYNIKIPRIVYEKLAPDVNVSVNATLGPKN